MKTYFLFTLALIVACTSVAQDTIKIIPADHQYIQYYGRFDRTNPKAPRFWAPGAYIVTRFSGTDCEIYINDQAFQGSHSYIEVKVDNIEPVRIQLRARTNRIQIAKDLPGGDHTVTITKNTEASVGYLEFIGFNCESLLPPPPVPVRGVEFVGDEITAGAGSDTRYMPCDSAEWYDQSNAYDSYGAVAARQLNARYHLTAVTGIGITQAAGQPAAAMPALFDKINLHKNAVPWDAKGFQPNVVVIYLGRNDDLTDSVGFAGRYLGFLKSLRTIYPMAHLVCMSGGEKGSKDAKLKNILATVVATAKRSGVGRVDQLYLETEFGKGCGGLPSRDEHQLISLEVANTVKRLLAW